MKSVHRGFSVKLLLVLILSASALLLGLTYILSISLERGNRLLVSEMHQVLAANSRNVVKQLLTGRAETFNARLQGIEAAIEDSSRALSHHLQRGGQLDEAANELVRRLLRNESLISAAFYCDISVGECHELAAGDDAFDLRKTTSQFQDVPHILPQLNAPGVSRWVGLRRLPYSEKAWGVQVLAAIYNAGVRKGFIGATIDQQQLNRLLEKESGTPGSFVLLLDSQQRLLAGSQDALLYWGGAAKNPRSVAPLSACTHPPLLTAIKDLQLSATGTEELELGSELRLLSQQKLARMDWSLLLVIPQSALNTAQERIDLASQAAREQIEKLFLLSGIGLLLLVVSFFQLQLRWMTRPIRSLIDAARAFSSGRLERRVEVPGDRELGALLSTFNEMADTVQAKIRALDDANEQLRQANSQLQDNLQASQQLNLSLEEEMTRRTDAEKALSLSEIRLQSILTHSPEPIFLKDTRGHYLLVNQAFEKLVGRPTDQIIGFTDLDIFPPSLAMQLQRNDTQVIAERQAQEFEENFGQMNRPRVFLTCRFLLFDKRQRPHALGGIAIDITQRKQAEAELRQTKEHLDQLVEARTTTLKQLNSNLSLEIEERRQALEQLKESETRYQVLLDNAWDGVAILRGGELYYANPALVRLLGAAQVDQIMWRSFLDFIAPERREHIADNYRRRLAGEAVESVYESCLQTLQGELIDVEISVGLATYHGVTVTVAVVRDIRARKQVERELQRANQELLRLSTTDALTGLYNRRYLMDTMNGEFSRARRYWTPLAIMMIDVDHFKLVNDRFGHHVGDEVLEHLGQVLHERTRQSDIAARYGGEELTVLLPQTAPEQALAVAETLRQLIAEKPFVDEDGIEVSVTISIGLACFPDLGVDSAERLLQYADTALYQAKEQGRNRVVMARLDMISPPPNA